MFGKPKNNNNDNTYGIVGIGRFGYNLAVSLSESGADILVIDKDEDKIKEMREYTENAYVVKTLDKKSLSDTGIQNCDVAIVCIGEQLDSSILTTLHLVRLGIPHVISKANTSEHGEILEKLGAEVVYPEKDMAVRLANRLITSKALDYVQLSEKLNISKVTAPDFIVGKTVIESDLRKKFGINIIAIENKEGLTENISPLYVFKNDDILYIAGEREKISAFSAY